MRKTGSFELYAISAVRDTLVLLCALSELCVEDPIPIPEVFNTEDAEFTETKPRSFHRKGTETQRSEAWAEKPETRDLKPEKIRGHAFYAISAVWSGSVSGLRLQPSCFARSRSHNPLPLSATFVGCQEIFARDVRLPQYHAQG